MASYYSEHAQEYIDSTFNCDVSLLHAFFEGQLPKGATTILDLGFGSGRDSLYFLKKGYEVVSLDPTKEFCENGIRLGLPNVINIPAQKLEEKNRFDGIWACASLLHVPSSELTDVFIRCAAALKPNGIIHVSFKLGEFEGERNGRFFNDMTIEKLSKILEGTNLIIERTLINDDVRPDRDERWLDVLLTLRKLEKLG